MTISGSKPFSPVPTPETDRDLPDPVSAYDAVAADFPILVARCRRYLDAVDALIVHNLPNPVDSLLDVGAGDGRRARRIAALAGVRDPVLLEPSHEMRAAGGTQSGYLDLRAEDLKLLGGNFDIILCLWNVFGHVLTATARAEVLRQMKRLLSPGGRVFLDVNHRYNARRYGYLRTAGRVLFDLLRPSDRNGDVVAEWNLSGRQTRVRGHVFTHREMVRTARAAGLTIEKRYIVDYETGRLCRFPTHGSLLYIMRSDSA